jgi:CTP synthase (UTP-ammonia lyase)
LAEKLELGKIKALEGRLDLTMGGLEEKATMWNLIEGDVANEQVLAKLDNGESLCGVSGMTRSMTDWARMAFKLDGFQKEVKIVIVGKYTGLQDSYLSVIKSLKVSMSFMRFTIVTSRNALKHSSSISNCNLAVLSCSMRAWR